MEELINPAVVAQLRAAPATVAPAVDLPSLTHAERLISDARLRQRVDIVRDALLDDLPRGFAAAERIVLDMLNEPRFSGWRIWPVTEVVALRTLEAGTETDFDAAMALLARLTVGLTGEFAVRDPLIARPKRGLSIMHTWTGHDDENVRRLATEGSRPFLPWAKRVPWLLAHPQATLSILDAAYRDSSAYVRRSVATHLNETQPRRFRRRTRRRQELDGSSRCQHRVGASAQPQNVGQTGRIHRANSRRLHGRQLACSPARVSRDVVAWGATVEFTTEVTNSSGRDATVAIDYSIGFQRANGSVRPRTFKLGSRKIPAGASVVVTGSHSFRPIASRTYYPGWHFVTVQANGTVSPQAAFIVSYSSAHDEWVVGFTRQV